MPDKKLILVGIASLLTGAAAGGFATFKIYEKKLMAEFDEAMQIETEKIRAHYGAVQKTDYVTPKKAVEELVPAEIAEQLTQYKGAQNGQKVAYNKVVPSKERAEDVENLQQFEEVSEHQNVFKARDEERRGKIYVMSEAEFVDSETYPKQTVTWYTQDEKLTDEQEELIDDPESILGTDFHTMFGWQTDDQNTMFIRNDIIQIDYEVLRSESAYAIDVLGETEYVVEARPSGRGG